MMKKIAFLLILLLSSIAAFAEDSFAYISNVERNKGGSVVEVTVEARPGAFNTYPQGFDVVISPTKDAWYYLLGASGDEVIHLSPNTPVVTLRYNCNESNARQRACSLQDFRVKTKSY